MPKRNKRPLLCDMKDLSLLPEGQVRAVVALIGGNEARTYIEASVIAGTSINTLYTYLRRIRSNHPKLYEAVCIERKSQLRARHRETVARARESIRNSTSGVSVRASSGAVGKSFLDPTVQWAVYVANNHAPLPKNVCLFQALSNLLRATGSDCSQRDLSELNIESLVLY